MPAPALTFSGEAGAFVFMEISRSDRYAEKLRLARPSLRSSDSAVQEKLDALK